MTATANPLPTKYGDFDFPRRAVVEAMHRAEQAIRNAMYEVEQLGADPLLTDAGTKLIAAKDLVSDWLEGNTGLDAQLAAPGAPEPKKADFYCFPAGTYPIAKPAQGERQPDDVLREVQAIADRYVDGPFRAGWECACDEFHARMK